MVFADLHAALDALAAAGQFHRLGWVVMHSLWQAAAVAAVLAVVPQFVPRRPAFGQETRYLLATLALFCLPAACGVTWALVEPLPAPTVAVTIRDAQGPTLPLPVPQAGAVMAERAAAPLAGPSIPDVLRQFAGRAARTAEPWLSTCATLWLLGVAAAVRLGVGWSLTRRLIATAAAVADTEWQARLDRWRAALGITSPIGLVATAQVEAPIVVGWLRPIVAWPLAAVTGMPPAQIDAILVHELAHVRRHDVLVNLLQSVVEAVFFHHPAAWWISAQVRAEREHCADELAIRTLAAARAGSRVSYATALLALEERRHAILAAAANGGSLGDRIRRPIARAAPRPRPPVMACG